jgi:hypothetical protein
MHPFDGSLSLVDYGRCKESGERREHRKSAIDTRNVRLLDSYDRQKPRFAHAEAPRQLRKPVIRTERRNPIVEPHRLFQQGFPIGTRSCDRVTETGQARRQNDVTHQQ